jgi:hypothetical protein
VCDAEYDNAIAIEAHISYHGAESHLRRTHEVRTAVHVAVHREWYDDNSLKHNDIAVITLRTAFDEATPLKWGNCPVKGEKVTLGVVGYPVDIPSGREGQYMYESTGLTDWDLEKEESGMLIHRLDTFSGKPPRFIAPDALRYSRQFRLTSFPYWRRPGAGSHRDSCWYNQNSSN